MNEVSIINSSMDPKDFVNFKLEYQVPDRVKFYYSTVHRSPSDDTWLSRALKSEILRYQLLGALRTLAPKGKEIAILVCDIISPMVIPNVSMYLSENNNWHVGKAGVQLGMDQLRELNPDEVSYYQDNKFFLALKHSLVGHSANVEQYILYVHQKSPRPEGVKPRAKQD